MKTILIAASLALSAPATMEAPLQPTGKWTVEYADDLCVLSRTYGTADAPLIFGIRPSPLSDSIEIVLIQPNGGVGGVQTGSAKLVIRPGKAPIDASYTSTVAATDKPRITKFAVPRDTLATFADATSVDIALSGKAPLPFALSRMKAALNALSTCTDDLLRTWHIDPAEQSLVATRPEAITALTQWITNDDWPSGLLARKGHGSMLIVWLIDTDGRVKNCRVVTSSGEPSADAAACAAITKRGHYRPARDKDGNPIAIHSSRRIVWNVHDQFRL